MGCLSIGKSEKLVLGGYEVGDERKSGGGGKSSLSLISCEESLGKVKERPATCGAGGGGGTKVGVREAVRREAEKARK